MKPPSGTYSSSRERDVETRCETRYSLGRVAMSRAGTGRRLGLRCRPLKPNGILPHGTASLVAGLRTRPFDRHRTREATRRLPRGQRLVERLAEAVVPSRATGAVRNELLHARMGAPAADESDLSRGPAWKAEARRPEQVNTALHAMRLRLVDRGPCVAAPTDGAARARCEYPRGGGGDCEGRGNGRRGRTVLLATSTAAGTGSRSHRGLMRFSGSVSRTVRCFNREVRDAATLCGRPAESSAMLLQIPDPAPAARQHGGVTPS